ncbi:MAG: DUF2934 domain-containing protein [Candidatus Thiodiazotropha sp.]|jgi:hypothetical protein
MGKKKLSKQMTKNRKQEKKAAEISPQQRIDMIAEAAYFIAEKHGFDPQRVTLDWEQAEKQIDEMLKSEEA